MRITDVRCNISDHLALVFSYDLSTSDKFGSLEKIQRPRSVQLDHELQHVIAEYSTLVDKKIIDDLSIQIATLKSACNQIQVEEIAETIFNQISIT